jgi:predicted metal-dependent phosphoesterase TrpH
VIDLHTHSTASDGRCSPTELVARAARAGVTVLALTDHDTVAGHAAAAGAATERGIEFVTGIEITAAVDGADVHVLGYFFDAGSPVLNAYLDDQRRRRMDRVREIVARLHHHGIALDADAILQPGIADRGRAVGRPWVARAMVDAGYVASVAEAFDGWLARGRPAFVPRIGPAPEQVFDCIHRAGGLASLAHPVLVGHDEWIPKYADAGLDALEAHHTDHKPADVQRYLGLAARLNLGVTGGSDYHADDEHGGGGPGSVSLPRPDYDALRARHESRRT